MTTFRWVVGVAGIVAIAAACKEGHDVTEGDGYRTVAVFPASVTRDLDILFMIDDSPSMAEKQSELAANFPSFINVLNTAPGGLPNIHLGVATTDLGTKAAMDAAPGPAIGSVGQGGCSGSGKNGNLQLSGAPVMGPFISDISISSTMRQKNYTGDLATVFGMMARPGAGGCGFEQPLEATRRALNNNVANAGFLRSDANLLIVFLADEDDCSAAKVALFGPESTSLGALESFRCTRFGVTCDVGGKTPDEMNVVGAKSLCHASSDGTYLTTVDDFVSFTRTLKTDSSKIAVAAIMGSPSPVSVEVRAGPSGNSVTALARSCTGTLMADPGVRLQSFLDGHVNNISRSLCEESVGDSLVAIGELGARLAGSTCIDSGDLPEKSEGVYDCVVEDVRNFGIPTETKTRISQCKAGAEAAPCWKLTSDASCVRGSKIEVVRSSAPEAGSVLRVRCKVD